MEVLVHCNINNYEMILGANFLLDESYMEAITPNHLILKGKLEPFYVPFCKNDAKIRSNILSNNSECLIRAGKTESISAESVYNQLTYSNMKSFTPFPSFAKNGIVVEGIGMNEYI